MRNQKLKVFTFALYCSEQLQIQIKNSLDDNFDHFSYQHELRKYGEKVKPIGDPQSTVFIRRIKSETKVYYYGVQNDTEGLVEATLEFKQKDRLVAMNKDFVISRQIPPKGL